MMLIELQRDFRKWLTAESTEAAARLGDPQAHGLGVYLNTYRGQLLACLNETFPAVRAWIGDAAFDAAAAAHIDRVPPSSWTLDAYARDLPATLANLYPEDPEITELASLERALADCFVGLDAPSLTAEALGEVDWDCARLRLVPTSVVLDFTTNAADLWTAIDAGGEVPGAITLPHPVSVALWRKDFVARFRELDADEAYVLRLALGGASFGDICAEMITRHGADEGIATAGAALARWLQDGLIEAVD